MVTVVKLGGTTVDADARALAGLTAETAREHQLVVVHGGGKRLTAWLDRLGVESRFENGLRVTDDAALEAAVAVFAGLVNTELVAALQRIGVPAVGLTGVDGGLLVGQRVSSLGRVVQIQSIRREPLDALLNAGLTPVVAPIAPDQSGDLCNVNADDVAAALAAGTSGRLLLLTDTPGVLDGDGRTIASLDGPTVEQLIGDGTIRDGMVPKVRGALAAVADGVTEVVIADGRGSGALATALHGRGDSTRVI